MLATLPRGTLMRGACAYDKLAAYSFYLFTKVCPLLTAAAFFYLRKM